LHACKVTQLRPPLEFAPRSAYLTLNNRRSGTAIQMAKTNPLQFIQQVRGEVAKVVWPTRREVILTTVMVFIMAALTATFFSLVDMVIRAGLRAVLG
jgi:preprotein translocase subunit SecE